MTVRRPTLVFSLLAFGYAFLYADLFADRLFVQQVAPGHGLGRILPPSGM